MDFFSKMFSSMFQSSVTRFKNRAEAQVRQNTIGKVQAKAMSKMAAIDKAAYNASDRVTGIDKRNRMNRSADEMQRNRQMASRGAGGAGQGKATEQQESAKMGKGKRNKHQRAMSIKCMSCGSDLNADWDICPYCGTPVGQVGGGAPAPQLPMGAPVPAENNGEKTMALNMDDLNMTKQRTVVGWIVAQNGNHRGEDFRIYDGKNILGTAADCDIVITDPFLSAKHCTIRHENGNFQVTDLDSMNGTFVNQKRCTKSDLIDNDTIRLGRTEFKFKSLF